MKLKLQIFHNKMEKYSLANIDDDMSIKAVKAASEALIYQINKIPRHDDFLEVNVIFPCAGDGVLERTTLSEVKKTLPFIILINNVYLIDIVYDKEAVNIMEDIACKVVSCTYDDMNKILLSIPMKVAENTVCVSIHPQLMGSRCNDEDIIPILSAMDIDTRGESMSNLQIKLLTISFNASKYQAGLFLRLWLGHFHRYYCTAWRNERWFKIHLDDMNLQDPSEIDPLEFYDKVYKILK